MPRAGSCTAMGPTAAALPLADLGPVAAVDSLRTRNGAGPASQRLDGRDATARGRGRCGGCAHACALLRRPRRLGWCSGDEDAWPSGHQGCAGGAGAVRRRTGAPEGGWDGGTLGGSAVGISAEGARRRVWQAVMFSAEDTTSTASSDATTTPGPAPTAHAALGLSP